MQTNQYQTLSDELRNNIIIFVDKSGETKGTFDFIEKRPYFYGDITKDIEIKLIKKQRKSKYYKMLDIDDDYYYGTHNVEQKNNIMCKMFKIIIQNNIFGGKYNYLLLIIDNPNHDITSTDITKRGKYKLIIYNIFYNGIYLKYLHEVSSYTSLI
jgi:hypothetical protein